MLHRSLIVIMGLSLSLLPGVASAQTQPGWQDWVKQNPTYSNPPATSPTPSRAPATSWSDSSDSSTLTEQQFTEGFMQGCTGNGAPQNYCSCALSTLKSRYSIAQLLDMSRQSGTRLVALIEDISAACIAEIR
jgi:hypothetical protein